MQPCGKKLTGNFQNVVQIVAVISDQLPVRAVFQPSAAQTAHRHIRTHEAVFGFQTSRLHQYAACKGKVEEILPLYESAGNIAPDGKLRYIIRLSVIPFLPDGHALKRYLMIAEITENKGFAAFVQITVETFHRFVQIGNAPM